MEIIALQQYTDKYISLYEGEIRNIGSNLANKLIALGIAQKHGNEFLPNVSTADNGKVLSVTNGAWSAAEGSGSGGSENKIFIAKFYRQNNIIKCENTFNEIKEKIQNGYLIFGILDGYTFNYSSTDSVTIDFSAVQDNYDDWEDEGDINYKRLRLNSSESVKYWTSIIKH